MFEIGENNRKVLFVDDEPSILASIKRALRKEQYTVLVAASAQEAMDIIVANEVQVVISDQRMPDMDGTELLQKIKQVSPGTVRAILSGYANADVIVDSINKGEVYRFIPKPWELEDLKEAINQCLKHSEVMVDNFNLIYKAHATTRELRTQYHQLENAAEHRNMILEFTQEMLEYTPYSMLGINVSGEVLICNEHARTSISEFGEFDPGTHIDRYLPGCVWQVADEALKMHMRVIRQFELVGGIYEFEFIPLVCSRINGLLAVIKHI